MVLPSPILELSDDVVRRIAAGEVIHQASSAFKEILENSLDAGATEVEVVLLEGGGFQLRDDGHGIRTEDLPILCRRHMTSKIQSLRDLEGLQTLGFRGEALCSVSYVAQLTVTTRSTASPVGWRASFSDGELQRSPAPCSALVGTVVRVEMLFERDPVRRAALTAPEEYARAANILKHYAVDALGVGFTLRREDRRTPDFSIQPEDSQLERILKLFGCEAARELTFLEEASLPKTPSLSLSGWFGALAGRRKRVFALSINSRCVEFPLLKRAVNALYASLLPKREPFVFLSLRLPASQLDVNIHPTKREVSFRRSEDVIQGVVESVQTHLLDLANRRTVQANHSRGLPPLRCAADTLTNRGVAEGAVHAESRRLIEGHSYVGIAEGRHVFVHFESDLYMLDSQNLSRDFFSQLIWKALGKLKRYVLDPPVLISELLQEAAESELRENGTTEEDSSNWIACQSGVLMMHRESLNEWLSVGINEEGWLVSLPLVLESYPPFADRLPVWLLNLSEILRTRDQPWTDLTPLVDAMSQLLVIRSVDEGHPSLEEVESAVEQVLMPAMMKEYMPTVDRVLDHSIVKLASIQQLCSRCQR